MIKRNVYPWDYVTDLFFPPKCIFCGKLQLPGTRPMICYECLNKVPADVYRCVKCGGAPQMSDGRFHCYTCKSVGRHYDAAFSLYPYKDEVRDAILRFKFGGNPAEAADLAYLLSDFVLQLGFSAENIHYITYVPSDKQRERKRGFHHMKLIAGYVGKYTKIPIHDHAVEKMRSTPAQSTLSAHERAKNIVGAFSVPKRESVKDKCVILLDDVFTTGATAIEVSKMLKRAGAKYVCVITLAHT